MAISDRAKKLAEGVKVPEELKGIAGMKGVVVNAVG